MEKVKLVSLGLLPEAMVNQVNIGDALVDVKSTLPYEEVLEMISWTINKTVDDRGYVSEPIKQIIKELAIVKYFTNIDLDAMDLATFNKGQLYESYDFIAQHHVMETITPYIDPVQLDFYKDTLEKTIASLIAYRNSAAGVIEMISQNGEQTSDHFTDILKKLENSEEDFSQLIRMMELAQPQTVDQPNGGVPNTGIAPGDIQALLK